MTQRAPTPKADPQHGFVLVNALVLVAAMAAAAVFVLGRAEESRVHLGAAQQTNQLMANLDAFEAYATLLLAQDDANVDHLGDIWARPARPLPLGRGQVEGQIIDLESRFNLNWLASSFDQTANQSFQLLLQRLSIRRGVAQDISDALSFQNKNARSYATLDPAQAPMAGPRFLPRQMRNIPTLSADDWRALAPYVTVLPAGSGVNVNTASEPVLSAVLPILNPTQISQLTTQRRQRPFASIEAFQLALETLLGEDTTDKVDWTRLRVSSAWFGVTINGAFDGQVASRRLVMERTGPRERARVYWRISQIGVSTPHGEVN